MNIMDRIENHRNNLRSHPIKIDCEDSELSYPELSIKNKRKIEVLKTKFKDVGNFFCRAKNHFEVNRKNLNNLSFGSLIDLRSILIKSFKACCISVKAIWEDIHSSQDKNDREFIKHLNIVLEELPKYGSDGFSRETYNTDRINQRNKIMVDIHNLEVQIVFMTKLIKVRGKKILEEPEFNEKIKKHSSSVYFASKQLKEFDKRTRKIFKKLPI